MRRALAALVAVAALAALLPGAAAAKPGFHRTPRSRIEQAMARGSNGYWIDLVVADRDEFLFAFGPGLKGEASIVYQRHLPHPPGDDVSFDLGRAGRIEAHFVPGKVERSKPFPGCTGKPQVERTGTLVGTFDFHARGGVTSLHRHKLRAAITLEPSRSCHLPGGAAAERFNDEQRLLVAGTPSGDRRFTATTYPPVDGQPSFTTFKAESRRHEGGLQISDSVTTSLPPTTPFAVPRLGRLPATSTVELPAPFSGSASFDLPSAGTATVSGDLGAEVPEVGKVALAGPGTAAGVCLGYDCTGSLPRALRPSRHTKSFSFISVTSGSTKPAS
jgi:hypothetical protein